MSPSSTFCDSQRTSNLPAMKRSRTWRRRFSNFGSHSTAKSIPLRRARPDSSFFQRPYVACPQIRITINGHLVRGALTHGTFYFTKEENILISPAFMKAYKGEQSLTSSPSVIIDPATLQEFKTRKSWLKDHKHEAEYVYKLLRLDADGLYFMDYLKAIYNEVGEPNDNYPDYMLRHKTFIESTLRRKLPDEVRRKYIWLGNYHNKVRSEFSDGEGTEDEGWLKGTEVSEDLLKL